MGLSISSLLPFRWRLWLGKQLFAPIALGVTRLSWHRVAKGPLCCPPEIEAMQYIAANTNIPIPKLYGTHIHNGELFIEMEYVPGESLAVAWRDGHLTSDQNLNIAAELKQHISTLRALRPPTDLICSAFQNPATDCRIGSRFFGPLPLDEFHSLARGHCHRDDWHLISKEMEVTHQTKYKICFTHADLAPRNIMVKNGRIVAIIDWAFSGWYPEYWDYTKAHYVWNEKWYEFIPLAFPLYENELKTEAALWEKLPEPGDARYTSIPAFSRSGSVPSDAWMAQIAGRELTDLWTTPGIQSLTIKWIKTEYHASTFLLRAQLSNSFGIIYLGELADPNLREPGNRRVRMQVAQIQDTLR